MKKKHKRIITKIALGVAEEALLVGLNALDFGLTVVTTPKHKMTIGHALRESNIHVERNRRVVASLLRKGFIAERKTKDGPALVITTTGKRALTIQLQKARRNTPQWDGMWRFVLFSVPESHRPLRDAVRYRLVKSHMKRIHEGFWITPYPIENVVGALSSLINEHGSLVHGTINQISDDAKLRRLYGLM